MSSNNSPKSPNNSMVHTLFDKPNSPRASPRASPSASPRASKTNANKEVIYTLQDWLSNTHMTLLFPGKVLTVFSIILLGAFIKTAPRKSLEFLDSYFSLSILFAFPFLFVYLIDWPTGLLVATIVVIIYARLQNQEEEGFTGSSETTLVSDPKRWFVEKTLGETPLGTVSKEVDQLKYKNNDSKTSSSSSMSNTRSSSGTK